MLGMGLSACASKKSPAMAPTPRRRVHLVPAQISWDRIIRTTVGLRPHRPSGFVLKAEKIDDKLVVHNYGHGGSGMSLSWGTGQMAAELALEHVGRRAAVLGCGMVGLTCTRQLQRRGFDVTIYAMTVPPHNLEHVLGWVDADVGPRELPDAHARVGSAVPTGGDHRLPGASASRRLPLWRVVDRQLYANRRCADGDGREHSSSRCASKVPSFCCSPASTLSLKNTRFRFR